jgi:hypothetical protein
MSAEAWNAMSTIVFILAILAYVVWSRWLDYKSGKSFHHVTVPHMGQSPVFEVLQISPDCDSPNLSIDFRTYEDRERAMEWFKLMMPGDPNAS